LLPPQIQAQDQESKLVDRLLRPDTTLQNSAQNKRFVAATVAQDRQAHVGKFYWQEKTNAKTFSGTREFSSRQFRSQSFRSTKDPASLIPKTVHKSNLAFGTTTASGLRSVAGGDKKAGASDFAGSRPFLGKGKSQKALSQQNRPMTIDEVRELLNKNK
jgi:hypothetical protein